MSERPKEHASKACEGATPPWVQIPPPPPASRTKKDPALHRGVLLLAAGLPALWDGSPGTHAEGDPAGVCHDRIARHDRRESTSRAVGRQPAGAGGVRGDRGAHRDRLPHRDRGLVLRRAHDLAGVVDAPGVPCCGRCTVRPGAAVPARGLVLPTVARAPGARGLRAQQAAASRPAPARVRARHPAAGRLGGQPTRRRAHRLRLRAAHHRDERDVVRRRAARLLPGVCRAAAISSGAPDAWPLEAGSAPGPRGPDHRPDVPRSLAAVAVELGGLLLREVRRVAAGSGAVRPRGARRRGRVAGAPPAGVGPTMRWGCGPGGGRNGRALCRPRRPG